MPERSLLRCLQILSHPLPDRQARRAALPSQSCRGTSERPAEGAGPGLTLTLQRPLHHPSQCSTDPQETAVGLHRVQSLPRLALSQHTGVNMTRWSRDTPTPSSPLSPPEDQAEPTGTGSMHTVSPPPPAPLGPRDTSQGFRISQAPLCLQAHTCSRKEEMHCRAGR